MAKPWMDISVEMRDGMVHWPGDPECYVGLHVKLGDPIPGILAGTNKGNGNPVYTQFDPCLHVL